MLLKFKVAIPNSLIKSISSLVLMGLASHVHAGEVLLNAFKDLSPISDGIVKVDEQRIPLSSTGSAAFELDAGSYTVIVQQYGQQLVNFPLKIKAGESNADISVLLEEGVAPEIEIKSYADKSSDLSKPGIVSGFVTSRESGEALTKIVISAKDGTLSTTSQEDGSFELSLPRGQYDLRVAGAGLSTSTVANVSVAADSFMELNFSLAKEGSEDVEELVAVGSYIADTVTASERDSSAILEVIGSEQFSRFGDSSAASALKRVAGVSINDGKYAVVRGLNERYTAVTLNGSTLPSPDSTRRVVPLDIFPSSILSQISVSKSASADLPSDSTGGVIELKTTEFSGENIKKLDISLSATSNVTQSNLYTYEGSGSDLFGIDDGDRDIPGTVSSLNSQLLNNTISDADRELMGEAFANNYALEKKKALPDFSIEYSAENTLDIEGTDNQWSYIGAIKYKNTWDREKSDRSTYGAGGGVLTLNDNYQYDRASNNIDLGGVFSASLNLNTAHTLTSNTMLLRQSKADGIFREGIIGDNNRHVKRSLLGWEEKQFIIQQFIGEHNYYDLNDLVARWRLGISSAELSSPDNRAYSYETPEPDTQPHELFDSSIEREFTQLNDDNLDFGTSLEGFVFSETSWQLKAKAGFDYFDRQRDAATKRFGYTDRANDVYNNTNLESVLTPDNINSDQFELINNTLAADAYEGDWEYLALYAKTNLDYFDLFRAEVGFRSEDSTQTLNTADSNDNPKTTEIEDDGVLPSTNFTWFVNESFQTRIGFSQTKNRPDFREISEAIFYHPETRDRFRGNEELEVADIDNFDIRAEWYFSDRESVSLAYFSKDFTNPIETTAAPATGDSVVFSFVNQESATVDGIELDFKKELEFDRGLGFVSGNLSVIDSEVGFVGVDLGGESSRAMQGQPDDILNIQLGFDDYQTQWEYTLVANRQGESLFAVGVQDLPDINLEPRLQVDVSAKNQFKENLSIKASIDNITDSEVKYTQGGLDTRVYKKGMTFKVGMSWVLN